MIVNVQKIFFLEFCLKIFTALKFDIFELQIRFVVMDVSYWLENFVNSVLLMEVHKPACKRLAEF